MPQFDCNTTDWNKNGERVGATFLGNWVEERSVGGLVKDERGIDHVKEMSRNGHKGILVQDKNIDPGMYVSTAHAQQHSVLNARVAVSMGKRRAALEAELLKRAIQDSHEPEEIPSTKGWTSIFKQDFGAAKVETIGFPDAQTRQKFSNPITFWNQQARLGNVFMCSTSAEALKHEPDESKITFKRNAGFSTPIEAQLNH